MEISPPVLYELGLASAIDWLAERAEHRHGLNVRSQQAGTPKQVSEDIQVFVFKAVQELINNVGKHAEASRVTIETIWHPDEIEIRVTDDGRGFDTGRFAQGLSADDSFGLFSIRERLSYAGGRIDISSAPGKGDQGVHCDTISYCRRG